MLLAIRRHKNAFSCAARMVQYHDRDKLDDAGNYYCALGWSFARGKGKNIDLYQKEEKFFQLAEVQLFIVKDHGKDRIF